MKISDKNRSRERHSFPSARAIAGDVVVALSGIVIAAGVFATFPVFTLDIRDSVARLGGVQVVDASLDNYVLNYLRDRPDVFERVSATLVGLEDEALSGLSNLAIVRSVPGRGERPILYELADYNCGVCRLFHRDLESQSDPPLGMNLRVIPVAQFGKGSEYAAIQLLRLGECGLQREQAELHDNLMEFPGPVTQGVVDNALVDLGVSERMLADCPAATAQTKLDSIYAVADAARLNGTPAFIVEGRVLVGYSSLADLERRIRFVLREDPA